MAQLLDWLTLLIDRGGPVMYPLLALSVISLTLILERSWFWLNLRRRAADARLRKLNDFLRRGDWRAAAGLAGRLASPYGRLAMALVKHGPTDAVALEAAQLQRPQIERFMLTLSTIITAAPLLGILGTVTGIIQSFQLLGQQASLLDPRMVSEGIAEALVTTAVGLVIALFTLFPYMAFRVQVERATGRMESLIAAAQQGVKAAEASLGNAAQATDSANGFKAGHLTADGFDNGESQTAAPKTRTTAQKEQSNA